MNSSNNNCFSHITFFYFCIWKSFFNRNNNNVSDRSYTSLRAAKYFDTKYFFCSRVISNVKSCLHLNHKCTLTFCRLYDFTKRPALSFAQWTSFVYFYDIANFRFIFFVMSFEYRSLFNVLSVFFVFNHSEDQNRDSFIHLVADHFAYDFVSTSSRILFHSLPQLPSYFFNNSRIDFSNITAKVSDFNWAR